MIGSKLAEVQHDDHGGKQVAREGERVGGVPVEEVPEQVALPVEHLAGGAEEAVVDVAAVEAALAEAVVEERAHGRGRRGRA